MTLRDKPESQKGILLSGNKCVVCGWQESDCTGRLLVEGAHARPFANTSDYDKSENIFGLCPNHHTEYDAGNFTIDPTTHQCIHANPSNPLHQKRLASSIDHVQPGYFDYHRVHVFQKRKR
ncbi:HNH endonuclease [Candidatus Kaiserbacteria bacterium]|nr:HNH endonuclease [Candidatus Kaiserbacteria bacterium]